MEIKTMQEMELDAYKRSSKQAAKDLGYSPEIINKIKDAKSIKEIANIMRNARYAFWEKRDFVVELKEKERRRKAVKRKCTNCKYSKQSINMMPCSKCECHSKWKSREE